MKKILVAVDMQKDFIDGSLGTKEAQQITAAVVRAVREGGYDKVYATMDTHGPDYLKTEEGRNLPVEHCIRGSEGWQFPEEIREALAEAGAEVVEKPAFGSLVLMEKVREDAPDEIVLCGLCTDICVISNALLLKAACHEAKMKVIADACAGVTPEAHEAALKVMQSCQIEII